MRPYPTLPDIFCEEDNDIFQTLFGFEPLTEAPAVPPAGTPANGKALADIVSELTPDIPAELPEPAQGGSSDSDLSASGDFVSAVSWDAVTTISPVAIALSPQTSNASTPGFEYANVGPPQGAGPGGGGGGGGGKKPTLHRTYTSGEADVEGVVDNFNINIQFYGDEWIGKDQLMEGFAAAADFLSSIMESGLEDDTAAFNTFSSELFTVDDVLIEAYLPDLGGVGGVLGRAGAYSVRDPGTEDQYTTVVGIMEFDNWDALDLLDDGVWDDTILHEMIHVLGFGSLWDNFYPDIITVTETMNWIAGEETKTPRDDIVEVESSAVYNGTAGLTEYQMEKDASMPADLIVETDGGSGTALAHWDEIEYTDELMTGYLNYDLEKDADGNLVLDADGNVIKIYDIYLSDWSLLALEDIGYEVISDFEGAGAQNALADGVDLETVEPLLAFYDADGIAIA